MIDRPEFSHIVRLSEIGSAPRSGTLSANEEERQKLAQRFDLPKISTLEATYRLVAGENRIGFAGKLESDLQQQCRCRGARAASIGRRSGSVRGAGGAQEKAALGGFLVRLAFCRIGQAFLQPVQPLLAGDLAAQQVGDVKCIDRPFAIGGNMGTVHGDL